MSVHDTQPGQDATAVFTVAQASVITGVRQKDINQYIDRDLAGLDITTAGQGARSIRPEGLLALRLAHEFADTLTLASRVQLIRLALASPKVKSIELDGKVTATIATARQAVAAGLKRYNASLAQVRSDPKILSGEPCLKGTRISVYTIAGLFGASGRDEVMLAYDITDVQLAAASVFAEANPSRGRPKSVEAQLKAIGFRLRSTKTIRIVE